MFPNPTWQAGFARNAPESQYPQLWDRLAGAWVPALGPFNPDHAGIPALYDLSFHKRNAVLEGGLDPATDWVLDAGQYALDFDGTGDQVRTANFVGDQPGGPGGKTKYTITSWVRGISVGANDAIGGWWDGSEGFFIQTTGTDDLLIVAGSGTQYATTTSAPLADDAWHHICEVYDGAQATDALRLVVYIDGVAETLTFNAAIPTVLPSIHGSIQLTIGEAGGLTRNWLGRISDFYVYDRAIPKPEIRLMHRIGRAGMFRRRTGNYRVIEPAISNVGSAFTDNDKTSQDNWNTTTSINITTGQLLVVVFVTDNESATDGDAGLHTSIEIDGNAMTKAREYGNSEGAGNAGSTVSIWYWIATGDVASGVTIATSNNQGRTAKAISGEVFNIGSSYVLGAVDGTQDGGTTGADLEALTATGTEDEIHLWIRGSGAEGPVETIGTMTKTAIWDGTFTEDGTTAQAAASNQTVVAEYRVLPGTSSGESDPTIGGTSDTASTMVGLVIRLPRPSFIADNRRRRFGPLLRL